MAAATANGGDRAARTVVWMIKNDGSLPADYKKATINTYLTDAVDNTTRVTVKTGAGFNPSISFSDKTTEGDSRVQKTDISGQWMLVAQTPAEYKALKAAFQTGKCVLVGAVGNPDLIVNPSTGVVTVDDTNGDELYISHSFSLHFIENPVDDAEMEIMMDFQKTIKGSSSTLAAWEAIVADA